MTENEFWSHVNVTQTGCWEWTEGKFSDGYGQVRLNGKKFRTHRLAWSLTNNQEIPKGKLIMHDCDNRICINPEHLLLGTHKANMKMMTDRGRQAFGDKNGFSKLNWASVYWIRKTVEDGVITQKQAALLFGMSKQSISNVVLGKDWKFEGS